MRTRIPILLVSLQMARSLPAVVAAARAGEPNAGLVGVLSLQVDSIGTDDVWRRVATARCGKLAAARSWVVFYLRPHFKKNPAFAEGVSYVARTPDGFRVWYRYR
jgi:hypothetical protein